MLKNKGFRVVFVGLGLILLFVCPVLAVEPVKDITGWDKAKFGMSPEGVKKAYKEEEEYFKQEQKVNQFWSISEEQRFGEEGLFGSYGGPSPYTLSTSDLKILEKEVTVFFRFVDDRLFEIEIKGETIYEETELEELKSKLKDGLIAKYGKPVETEEIKGNKILKWKDGNKNVLILKISLKPAKIERSKSGEVTTREGLLGEVLSYFSRSPSWTIKYVDKKLASIWEKKIANWEAEKEKLEEKGMESF